MVRPKAERPRNAFASFRITPEERTNMEREATRLGLRTLSEYVRYLHRENKNKDSTGSAPPPQADGVLRVALETRLGKALHGDSLAYLYGTAKPKSVDLILTSPPFGLVRKKSYGNEDADRYCEWFRPFAEGFKRVLKDNGSLVIDIGGAWKPGTPTRSLYHFELLLMLCKEYGFHLCQEHYWWSPSKLPTPAEWVNVRRVRVKDAVNCIWWLSPTPWPRSDNRRVLSVYSESMRGLLKNGYEAKRRPSGHDISEKFNRNNGGSVPPNLLAIANTESNGNYQEYCRANGLPIHPARFPAALPEYFIRLLTDQKDLVLDPFAGSCVTGAVAESLGRRWICCELDQAYLEGAKARFIADRQKKDRTRRTNYTIQAPCSLDSSDAPDPLPSHGGQLRPRLPKRQKPKVAVQPEPRAPKEASPPVTAN
jgi:site-specific DNA-methyltransferase (cytosine-N4-specific)